MNNEVLQNYLNELLQIRKDIRSALVSIGADIPLDLPFAKYSNKLRSLLSDSSEVDSFLSDSMTDFVASKYDLTILPYNLFFSSTSLISADCSGVEQIESYAFECMHALQKIWIPSTCKLGSKVFDGSDLSISVYTDAESLPSSWNSDWNSTTGSAPVVNWGSTHEDYLNA